MPTFTAPKTLGEFKDLLQTLDICVQLTPADLKALYEATSDPEREGRERIANALRVASDPTSRHSLGAATFLRNALEPYMKAPHAPSFTPATVANIADRRSPPTQAEHNNDFAQDEIPPPATSESNNSRHGSSHAASRTDRGSSSSSTTDPIRMQVKAFGKRAAMCAEPDTTKREAPTVRFELASSSGERQYDWSQKLVFQLTQDEIIQAAAVLFGFALAVNFKNHGEDAKWLSIEHQGNSICVKGGSKLPNSMRIVPIDVGRSTALAALLAAQLDKALFNAGSTGTLIPLLRNVAANLMNGTPRRAAG